MRTTGLAQVNTAVNQMDQVTQQNAAMVEESTAASRNLAGEAQSLGELVQRFKIGAGREAGVRADPTGVHALQARILAHARR